MYQPMFQNARAAARVYIDQFGGLNRQEEIGDNEFVDLCNLSSDRMPHLSPRKAREKVDAVTQTGIVAAVADNVDEGALVSFTGVAGTSFYYKGTARGSVSGDSDTCLVDFGGSILIFPDKKYYSYVEDTFGEIESGYEGASVSFDNTGSAEDGDLLGVITRTGGWDKFKSGDAVSISGASAANNTFAVNSKYQQADDDQIVSCVVSRVEGTKLYTINYNRKNERLAFTRGSSSATIKKTMPDITRACVSKNRVFGIDAAGEMIYACKLGDFTNWNVFEGLSTDSWYAQVGTEGKFTAIATLGTEVVLFKRNFIHQVFGSAPQNFNIPKQLGTGCIDGRSVCEAAGSLFFLAHDGFYLYNGGSPGRISDPLDATYTEAVSGCDGHKVYVAATRADGKEEFLVYDLYKRVWHREDVPEETVGFLPYNGRMYLVCAGGVYDMRGEGYAAQWSAVTKRYTDATMDRKGVLNVYVRFRMEPGASLRVYRSSGHEPYNAQFENGWELCGMCQAHRAGSYRVPVRLVMGDSYQLRFLAEGNVVLEAIEKVLYAGGRKER